MTAAFLVFLALQADAPKKMAFVGLQISSAVKAGELVITVVLPDSPAEKAGIKGGDVLLKIDGVTFDTLRTAVDAIRALKPGKKAALRVRRDGKEMDIEVIPAER